MKITRCHLCCISHLLIFANSCFKITFKPNRDFEFWHFCCVYACFKFLYSIYIQFVCRCLEQDRIVRDMSSADLPGWLHCRGHCCWWRQYRESRINRQRSTNPRAGAWTCADKTCPGRVRVQESGPHSPAERHCNWSPVVKEHLVPENIVVNQGSDKQSQRIIFVIAGRIV